MIRGDVVSIVLQGDYGKPRPAVIIQSDLFSAHPSVTVLPITSELTRTPLFRFNVEPTKDNGLQKISQAMIDKIHTVSKKRVGDVFGHLAAEQMVAINKSLAVFLGIV